MNHIVYRSLTALLLLVLTGISLSPARAQYYQITDLGTLPNGVSTYASGLNDAGQVVGTVLFGDPTYFPPYVAFLWDATNGMIDLDTTLGYQHSSATGINAQGQVCGNTWANVGGGIGPAGFLWNPGVPNGVDGGAIILPMTYAFGINDNGDVCGGGGGSPMLWTSAGEDDPPKPDWPWPGGDYEGPSYNAVAVNNARQMLVFGWLEREGVTVETRTYFYSRATGQYTRADGNSYLNDKGQIAGRPINNKGWQAGGTTFLRHGQAVDLTTRVLDAAGWSGIGVTGINNLGQMCGSGSLNGAAHAFLLDPVLPPPVSDFKGNGQNAIVFQNQMTGQLAIWLLDINNNATGAYIYPPQGDTHWKCVGTADFNGDGQSDLVFQNTTTGQLAAWYMQGTYKARGAYIYPSQNQAWQCVSVHDFNGDGNPDLLFQNKTTGQLAAWYLSGNYAVGGAFVYPSQDPDWRCVGTGDFNGDGQSELLFQSRTSGKLVAWYMSANYQERAVNIPMPQTADWQVVSVADYDGDGATDILFQNKTNGQLAVWYMGGTASADGAFLTPVLATNWLVVGPR